jgi:hypothetical protein
MTSIAATSRTISSPSTRPAPGHDWQLLRLTTLYVAVAAALIAALLAASVALTPASPTPDEMRLLQPVPGAAAPTGVVLAD